MKSVVLQHEVKKSHTEHEAYSAHSKTVLALKNEHLKRHYWQGGLLTKASSLLYAGQRAAHNQLHANKSLKFKQLS